jgi:LmbE family N-acetylglucosaminyl deacetylase
MLGLRIGDGREGIREVLCLGAHSDDIEIGCGGAILELVAAHPGIRVTGVVFSGDAKREAEARLAAQRFLQGAGSSRVVVLKQRDGFFPSQTTEIKEFFEELKRTSDPDIIFTHYRHDRHQDHRTISDLTWNTFRNHLVLEYEIPKYDGDLGTPNVFVRLSPQRARRKVKDVCSIFKSQIGQHWFTPDLFFGLMKIRGIECCADFAEAFYSRKVILDTASTDSHSRTGPKRYRTTQAKD